MQVLIYESLIGNPLGVMVLVIEKSMEKAFYKNCFEFLLVIIDVWCVLSWD